MHNNSSLCTFKLYKFELYTELHDIRVATNFEKISEFCYYSGKIKEKKRLPEIREIQGSLNCFFFQFRAYTFSTLNRTSN